jgi:Transmembrane domain of unknown function (DUF3566)
MADRRADDRPLAPRRPLSGASRAEEPERGGARRPSSERVSSAVRPGQPSGSQTSGRSGTPAAAARKDGSPGPAKPEARSGAEPAGQPGTGTPAQSGPAARSRGTRRARLRLTHVDPWSVMKTAFLLSIAFGIVTVVAVAVVWSVLSAAGVWDSINKTVADVVGGDTAQTFDVKNYVGTSRVLGFTMIVAVVDVVLITAISTLGAFLYNLSAALLGGVEVTLAEDER